MIRQTEKGAILEIRVKPRSSGFSISPEEGKITVRTKSPAEDNKANIEIVKNLSKLFGKEVRIVRGLQSRHKEIFVAGASPQEVEMILDKRKK